MWITKKCIVCYISTCNYLKLALGLYKGVLIAYLNLFGCFIYETNWLNSSSRTFIWYTPESFSKLNLFDQQRWKTYCENYYKFFLKYYWVLYGHTSYWINTTLILHIITLIFKHENVDMAVTQFIDMGRKGREEGGRNRRTFQTI